MKNRNWYEEELREGADKLATSSNSQSEPSLLSYYSVKSFLLWKNCVVFRQIYLEYYRDLLVSSTGIA